jgi:hypothetical protein
MKKQLTSYRMFVTVGMIASLSAGCALVVEPRYLRDGPEGGTDSSATVSDSSSTDTIVTELDVATPADTPEESTVTALDGGGQDAIAADAGFADAMMPADPRCTPGAVERCNGVDDNCNGRIDESPADVGARCVTDSGLPGTLNGACACVVAARPEVCGNQLDDDGNGIADDNCDCDVLYSSQMLVQGAGMPIHTQWAAGVLPALRAVNGAPKVVCVVNTVGDVCRAANHFQEDIVIPPDVQIVGGYRVRNDGNVVRDVSDGCRPAFAAAISFAMMSTRSSALVFARVDSPDRVGSYGIEMSSHGNLHDVIVRRTDTNANPMIGIGGNPGPAAQQWLNQVKVFLASPQRNSIGLGFVGGVQALNEVTVDLNVVNGTAVGARFQQSSLTARALRVSQLLGQQAVTGLVIERPTDAVRIQGFEPTAASVIAAFGNGAAVTGVSTLCNDAMVPISMLGLRWSGGTVGAPGGLATGVQNTMCQLLLRPLGATASVVIGAVGQLTTLEAAVGVNCVGGICDLMGAPGAPISIAAARPSAEGPTARVLAAVRALSDATVTLADALVTAGPATAPATTAAVGLAIERGDLYAERIIVKPTFAASSGGQRGIDWGSGRRIELRDSVVSVGTGIGIRINASELRPDTPGAILASSTVHRVPLGAPGAGFMGSVIMLDIVGMRRDRAIFRVENSILAPNAVGAPIPPNFAAVQINAVAPFSRLNYTLFADTSPIAFNNGVALNNQGSIGATLCPSGASMLFFGSANFISPPDFHILPSSPAHSNGSRATVVGRTDIDGQLRPLGVADIGADEIED